MDNGAGTDGIGFFSGFKTGTVGLGAGTERIGFISGFVTVGA